MMLQSLRDSYERGISGLRVRSVLPLLLEHVSLSVRCEAHTSSSPCNDLFIAPAVIRRQNVSGENQSLLTSERLKRRPATYNEL